MEEILASIRRIISEDDAPAEAEAPAAAAPAAPAAPEALPDLDIPAELPPMAAAAPMSLDEGDVGDDDVLELTDRVDEPEEEFEAEEPLQISDLEVMAPPAAARSRVPDFDLPAMDDDEPLVGEGAARSAASAFDALERGILMPPSGRTLEDVVREMLRPMMKAWLDENLPSIVQAQVAAEVDRISRQRRG